MDKQDVNEAVEVLRKGGVILYPTDTVWGLGCDATNVDAVKRIYSIKQRADSKAMITIVPASGWLERYVKEVPDIAWDLIDVAVEPLTIVYDQGKNLAPILYAADGSIGIRVTLDPYCVALCRRLGRPIVSTSANISGDKTPAIFSEISDTIKGSVDYIAQWRRDDKEAAKPSGVIKVSQGGIIKILR